jgi:hypothetical protein
LQDRYLRCLAKRAARNLKRTAFQLHGSVAQR